MFVINLNGKVIKREINKKGRKTHKKKGKKKESRIVHRIYIG